MTYKLKKFGRQCTKFGSHAAGVQKTEAKNQHYENKYVFMKRSMQKHDSQREC